MMYPSEIPMRKKIINEILEKKIIAIVRGADENQAMEVARALYEGGITLVEITFNLNKPETFVNTANAIRAISREFRDRMYVGAGTVTSVELLYTAMNAGAQYIISPDADEDVIKMTRQMGLVSLPGAYTPTEVKKAHASGADFVKLFPCIGDATAYMKAISAPLSNVRFLAVGGVDADNAADFIKAGAVGVGIGSSLVNKAWVEAGEYWRITEKAKELAAKLG